MKTFFTPLACLVFFATGFAQSPQLLKNINTGTTDMYSGSNPGKGIDVNGVFFFPAIDFNGNELWKTDGTPAGTQFIKDLASIFDRQDANPRLFNKVGNDLYFFALNGFHLYKYDPLTSELTLLSSAKDQAYAATEAVVIGDDIFFAGDWYFNQGVELLKYNITSNSMDIYDINPSGDSYPHNLTVKGDTLFFAADDGTNGTELWMYNGETLTAGMVKDINPTGSSNPTDLVIYNNKVFFTAADGVSGNELWSSDGDETNTVMYMDINTNNAGADSSNPAHKTVFNNKLYFSADNGTDGIEIWVADDNTSTAEMLMDINPFGDSNAGKYGFKQAGSSLYFAADDGSADLELWKTDGTTVGTGMVQDINPSGSSSPMDMYNLSDTLVFVADNGAGFEMWWTNGAETQMLMDIQYPFADTMHICGISNGYIYFGADNGVTGTELWKTDGKAVNTSMVKDINLGSSGISSDPQWFELYNSAMYFGARTSASYQFGLYKTDGTVGNATLLKDGGGAENFSVSYEHARKAGSYLYFMGYTSAAGNELWKTDGTVGGTGMVKDINPGTGESFPTNMIELGSQLIFVAGDGVNGRELWKTDGTAAGTVMIKDIGPGSADGNIRDMRLANGKIFFIANDGTTGDELWVTDGTTGGTFLLKDINGTSAGSDISGAVGFSTKLYFSANDGVHGTELWASDGTTLGTTMVKDINPGPGSSGPGWFAELGSYVYFAATDDVNQSTKIWRTDGTGANTSLFFDVNFPFLFTNIGSKLVFIADPATSTNGFHIWATDGTAPGTIEVEDFAGGVVGYFLLDEFKTHNNNWFVWLDDNVMGQELWKTDGTVAGTMGYDIAPGPHSSYPRNARGLNPLIFSADDGTVTGREVWKLDVSPVLPITGLDFNVTKQNDKALLQWKTYTEINNKGFQVQRSNNAIQFDSIGYVAAKGMGGNGASYQFTDANPFMGKNYYRLRQTDIDGKTSYSDIRWIDFSKDAYVKVFPNPTQDVLYINTGYNFRDATLSIRNMSGQLVKQTKLNGTGTVAIPVKGLPAGVYSAEIAQPSQTVRLMFIKQ